MFTLKPLLFLVAFILAFATARPIHHRGSCRHSSATEQAVSSSIEISAPAVSQEITSAAQESQISATSTTKTLLATATSKSPSPTASTSKTSAAAATSTAKAASLGGAGLAALMPVSSVIKSWSTSPLADNPFPLSDGTLRPHHLLKALSHDYVSSPDGKLGMKAHYPKGSYTFGHNPQGGLSFYAPGPSSLDLTTAKEVTFGYSVYFDKGFDFNLGGKLPGLYGGNSDEESVSCSGGRRSTACFSTRMMWREGGAGEFYTYLPPFTDSKFAANEKQCSVAPYSECNPVYGASVGRGAFKFTAGQWNTVSERIRLNDIGKANGEIELFSNGQSVIRVTGLILRDNASGRFRGMQMQTFFGGSKPQFASPKDQNTYFSDFTLAITQKL